MGTAGTLTAQIRFRAATHDDHGRITHYPGEVIRGELISRTGDFLLVRCPSGTCMYVDASRSELYCVELDDREELAAPPIVRGATTVTPIITRAAA